jgi:hypothetical protein
MRRKEESGGVDLYRSIAWPRGLLIVLGVLYALVSGAAAQLPAIPTDTPGMSIPQMFYLHAQNMDMKLLPTPLITRTMQESARTGSRLPEGNSARRSAT